MQASKFYSNGKLLLTGEYVVLDGAEALALPCKLGQSLSVKKSYEQYYTWTSYLQTGELWQQVGFSIEDILNNKFETDFEKRLFQILNVVITLNPDLFKNVYDFTTHLDFQKDWGLGSSSTLISNIAKWANIDSYELLDKTFGGSGYDIAAASMKSPFVYKRSKWNNYIKAVEIPKSITSHLFFVYLNQKQNSRKAITKYRETSNKDRSYIISEITQITQSIPHVRDLKSFETMMQTHENLISEVIAIACVHQQKFKDYKSGIIKSLGAWGGDFVLVTAKNEKDLNYFKEKNYNVIFRYEDLIL